MKHPNLVLFEPDDQHRMRRAQQLTRKGFAVLPCASVAALYDTLDRASLTGSAADGPNLTVYTRSQAHPRAVLDEVLSALRQRYCVIRIVEASDLTHERQSILDAGADVCVSPGCPPGELMAVIKAMHSFLGHIRRAAPSSPASGRRFDSLGPRADDAARAELHASSARHRVNERETSLQFATEAGRFEADRIDSRLTTGHGYGASDQSVTDHAHAYGEWTIGFQDWVLINPRGVHIGLTGVERDFFDALLQNDRRELSRKSMGEDGLAFKSVSVIVSRMRKKIGLAGCPLPLHTVHGRGYVFIGTLNRQPAA